MTIRKEYFDRSESWAFSNQEATARSRRTAWTAAGVAAGIAVFEAVALAMLVPLKTVQPITLLVDRQTGYVQALDPLQPKRIAADEALTQSLLAQYVVAREGFDRATVSADYRRVALWSAGRARSTYLASMPATNPNSPLNHYRGGTVLAVQVKSVSKLGPNVALVRFDTQRQDQQGRVQASQPWVSVVRYRYVNAPMQFEDRLVNPLGFQVIGYRRDAEINPQPASLSLSSVSPRTAVAPATDAAAVQTYRPALPRKRAADAASSARPRNSSPRNVSVAILDAPPNELPLGSPLSPNGSMAGSEAR